MRSAESSSPIGHDGPRRGHDGPHLDHDGWLLGYAPMDRLHEEFLALVHALAQAPEHAVAAALDALALNARAHFGAEDQWMAASAFPARACHIDEHAAVMRSIEGVQRRVARADFGAARPLADALLQWFPGHADYLDSALAHWLCKQRLGGAPIVLRRRIEPFVAPAAG
ncbi:bacteriohemerythrin [Verminephrobacter eiseniae]|uniref:Hemerythrin-like metal-binding protein n=3 Tax=Verminephrobacter eiseniae TaxID=364317 RepID=A1WM08_VEREI|nr:hemerythrin domain-containing protein [Verminephrobacter eiseniae]ABM58665.1 hemerythrin-like metal-binding protein [Verminephrobacter eiseniae EF01-2]